MSKFYGTVDGCESRTCATRCGGKYIRTSAQSWDGSIITRLHYDKTGNLMVEIEVSDDSSSSGERIWHGTFDEFRNQLRK